MYGISTYGINIVHALFTEEIRINKKFVNSLLNTNRIKGNLTLNGSIYWSDKIN